MGRFMKPQPPIVAQETEVDAQMDHQKYHQEKTEQCHPDLLGDG